MTNLQNIEKSAFRRGEYVGYARGVWRITKWHDRWSAREQGIRGRSLVAHTLEQLSAKLLQFEHTPGGHQ